MRKSCPSLFHPLRSLCTLCRVESPAPVPEKQSAYHPQAQRIAFCRRSGGAFVTRSLPFIFCSAATFESRGFQSLETYNAMNWRKFVLLGCVVACVFAASTATAQMRGHGNSVSRIGMRGAFTPPSIARMPMHRASNDEFSLGPSTL